MFKRTPIKARLRHQTDETKTSAFPMIQVMDPNATAGTSNAVAYVFHPWTLDEACKAAEGVTKAEENPESWISDLNGIINSYRLNGHEAGLAAQSSLGKHWAKIRGNYTGCNDHHVPLPYDTAANAPSPAFTAEWNALCTRVKETFARKADYGTLSGVKQKAGEDVKDLRARYEQQFKIHSGIKFNAADNSAYQQQLKTWSRHCKKKKCRKQIYCPLIFCLHKKHHPSNLAVGFLSKSSKGKPGPVHVGKVHTRSYYPPQPL